MEIGTCFDDDCQDKSPHYHCPVSGCNFKFTPHYCGGGGHCCCPSFAMHVHCRMCDSTDLHTHCNRCQRVMRNDYSTFKCDHCDLGGNCNNCNLFLPNILKSDHKFCETCAVCIDNIHGHLHCPTCNVVTNHHNKHYHCRLCNVLTRHDHIKNSHKGCNVENCTRTDNHMHCMLCDWVSNVGPLLRSSQSEARWAGPFQYHRHCTQCDRTDKHYHHNF